MIPLFPKSLTFNEVEILLAHNKYFICWCWQLGISWTSRRPRFTWSSRRRCKSLSSTSYLLWTHCLRPLLEMGSPFLPEYFDPAKVLAVCRAKPLPRVLSRVFEGQKLPPPKKILLSLQHISNYIGKIIQSCRGQCTRCNISQNCVSKCTRLHLSEYLFQTISGGNSPDPQGSSSPSATGDFSPKR